MNTKLIIACVAVGGLFVLVALMGGGTDETELVQQETKEEVQETTIVKLPADMPTNVPLYPGSSVAAVQETTQAGVRNITLTLTTHDSVADVNTWYRSALSADGWAVTSDRNVGGYVLLKGERGSMAVFMQAANGDGGSVITERIQIK